MSAIKKSISVSVKGLSDLVKGADETSEALDKAKLRAQKLTDALNKAAKEGNKTTEQMKVMQNELNKANDEVQKLTKMSSTSARVFNRFANSAQSISGGIMAAKEAMGTLGDETKTTGEKISTLADQASSVLMGLGPYGAVAAIGIQAVSAAWSYFNQEAEEAERVTIQVTQATNEAVESALKEYAALTDLTDVLNDTNASYFERNKALNEIQSKYGEYLGNVQLETLSLREQADMLDLVKNRLIENQIQKVFEDQMAEQLNRRIKNEIDLKTAVANKDREAARIARKNIREATDAYNQMKNSIDEVTQSTKEALGISAGFGVFVAGIRMSAADIAAEAMRRASEAARKQAEWARKAEEAEQKRLEYIRKQLEIFKLMNKFSQQRQAGIQGAIEAGDFAEAQRLLELDKQAWELEKERLKQKNLLNKASEQAIKLKQEELAADIAAAKIQPVIDARLLKSSFDKVENFYESISGLGIEGVKTFLSASLFEGLDVPDEFKVGDGLVKVFKDNLGTRTQQDIQEIVFRAFQTTNPEAVLKQYGITTVFDVVRKKNEESYKAAAADIKRKQDELEKMEKDYQKQEAEGKRDIDAEDKEKQKEFRKRQQEIDKAREEFNKRVKAAEEEAARQMASLGAILNDPDFEEQLKVLKIDAEKEQLASFEANVKAIEPLINRVNGMIAGTVKTDEKTKTINISTALADLLAQGKIAQEEYDQIVTITDLQNDLISRQKRAAEKREEDLKRDFVGQALDAFRKKNADLIKNFELSLVDLQLKASKLDNWYLPMIDNKLAEGQFAEALKLRKTYTNEQLKIVEEQKRIELELAENLYVQELINLEAQGFDVTQMRQNFLLKGTEIEIKYEEQKKRLRKEYHEAEKALMTQQITEVANMTAQALDIFNQSFMAGYKAVMDYVNALSEAELDKLNETLSSVEDQLSETQDRLSSLEDDLEGKRSGRRQAVLAAIELEKQREQELAAEKLRLMKQIEEEERAIARRKKAMAISEAIVSGAQSITSIWAVHAANPILAGILTAVAAGVTAAQIATISTQQFAEGGFTGEGTVRDSSGHRVAGIVHDGEWVAPKWMVNSPQFAPMIGNLERSRQGLTPNFSGMNSALQGNNTMEATLNMYTQAMMKMADRPVIANPVEFSNTATNMKQRQIRNTLGG